MGDMITRDNHTLDANYNKVPPKSTLMTFEEIVVLNRIIYPFNIKGNNLSQYEAFERVKKHLNVTHFKTAHARSVWSSLEYLHKEKMPFCDMFFEFGSLGDIWTTSGVLDIEQHINVLRGGKRGI